MKAATLPFSDVTKMLAVEITLTGSNVGKLRFRLAALIFRLGAFVAGTGLNLIEIKTK